MSDGGPLAVSFYDARHGLHASARAGATLLYEGSDATALPDGPEIEQTESGYRAVLDGAFDVELEPLARAAVLGGVSVSVCAVRGQVGGQGIDCLGTVAETRRAPEWDGLDALRSISALFDRENAFVAIARRPRGVAGHDAEEVAAWLLTPQGPVVVEEPRISTVYDSGGRQRSAGLELWLSDEDFAVRGSGTVVAGSSLELEGLLVHAAVFRWRLGGLEGLGGYELWTRDTPDAA